MKIVTSGYRFLDIDAYACMVAYAELFNLQGLNAEAVSTAQFNMSISPSVLSWGAKIQRDYIYDVSDEFVIVDVSNPEQIERFVPMDHKSIIELLDHHTGFETYWRDLLGKNADIAHIGAAATQVYQRWDRADMLDRMSRTSSRLLLTAILDNTLNFTAAITQDLDRQAYANLVEKAGLPSNWAETYFLECQAAIEQNIAEAIKLDMKYVRFPQFSLNVLVGQLVLWDMPKNISEAEILTILESYSDGPTFMNLVNISNGKSYLLTRHEGLKIFLTEQLDSTFDGYLADAGRVWLRKEIIKKASQNLT